MERTAKRKKGYLAWIGLAVILSGSLAAEPLIEKHPSFGFEAAFGFAAGFGFVGCVALVGLSRVVRRLLARDEGYYD